MSKRQREQRNLDGEPVDQQGLTGEELAEYEAWDAEDAMSHRDTW